MSLNSIKNYAELPLEILSECFSYLDTSDLPKMALVCQSWRKASSAITLNSLWVQKFIQHPDVNDSGRKTAEQDFKEIVILTNTNPRLLFIFSKLWRSYNSTHSLSEKLMGKRKDLKDLKEDEFHFSRLEKGTEYFDRSMQDPTQNRITRGSYHHYHDWSYNGDLYEKVWNCDNGKMVIEETRDSQDFVISREVITIIDKERCIQLRLRIAKLEQEIKDLENESVTTKENHQKETKEKINLLWKNYPQSFVGIRE